MTDVFPRRNLGRGDYWGATVEKRIKLLTRANGMLQERSGGLERLGEATVEELSEMTRRTMDLADDVETLLTSFPRYFNVAGSRSGFAVGPGWLNLQTITVPGAVNFKRSDVSAEATVFTRQAVAPPAGDLFEWPFSLSLVTSEFGARDPLPYHRGIDFGVGVGTPVIAAGDGVISLRGYYDDWGNYVRINHDAITGASDSWTGYAHLDSPGLLAPGTSVTKGQVIGYSGNTGYSTGPHLHFETATEGVRGNPRDFMAIWEGSGTPTSYPEVEARIVINGQISPIFYPYTEMGVGPEQLNFPIFGRSFVDAGSITAHLQVRSQGVTIPANGVNKSTFNLTGGFS